jgi:hypothetical protein
MYLYLKCSVKWGIQNMKFKIIIQHKNDSCHVQSLEKDFYLGAPNCFNYAFTLLGHLVGIPKFGHNDKVQRFYFQNFLKINGHFKIYFIQKKGYFDHPHFPYNFF